MRETILEKQIPWGDMDAMGIVFYPRYYEWFDHGGHYFFDALKINLWNLYKERGLTFNLVESSCRYFKPLRYFQEIRIVTFIDTLTAKTVTLKHLIKSFPDQEVMAEGMEKRICVDSSNQHNLRAVNIPDDIMAALRDAHR